MLGSICGREERDRGWGREGQEGVAEGGVGEVGVGEPDVTT